MHKILLFSLFAAVSGFANVSIPKVKTVGPMNHKVIYASSKFKLKQNGTHKQAFVKMIARWGVHVYEVGVAEFSCTSAGKCRYDNWTSLAFYQNCTVQANQAACRHRIKADGSASVGYNGGKGYYETHSRDFERETNYNKDYYFPERGSEYWEYPASSY